MEWNKRVFIYYYVHVVYKDRVRITANTDISKTKNIFKKKERKEKIAFEKCYTHLINFLYLCVTRAHFFPLYAIFSHVFITNYCNGIWQYRTNIIWNENKLLHWNFYLHFSFTVKPLQCVELFFFLREKRKEIIN